MGQLADLAEELAVGQGVALARLVGFEDDGGAVGVLCYVAVDHVVGCVELPFEEPGHIAMAKGARHNRLEVSLPCEVFPSHPRPELIGICNRLLIQALVFGKPCSSLETRLFTQSYFVLTPYHQYEA